MKRKVARKGISNLGMRCACAITCAALLAPGDAALLAREDRPEPARARDTRPHPAAAQEAATQEAVKVPADQLDALVAPIALCPDPLLSQTLVASTYPLELIQLQQWLAKNSGLTGKKLSDAVAKQPWDPSIQAMAA